MGMGAMAQVAEQDLTGLVESAAEGDHFAFGRIVAAYHEDMRRVCAYVTRDDALAEDATQMAWSVAWQRLGTLQQADRLRPWLISVAVNQAKDAALASTPVRAGSGHRRVPDHRRDRSRYEYRAP